MKNYTSKLSEILNKQLAKIDLAEESLFEKAPKVDFIPLTNVRHPRYVNSYKNHVFLFIFSNSRLLGLISENHLVC